MKRSVTIVIAVLVLLTASCKPKTAAVPVAAGDSNFNAAGLPILKTPVQYKMMAPRTPQQGDWNQMWVFAKIKELTNIEIQIDGINSEAWTERKNLAFASNTLPDFFIEGLTDFDIINFGEQGMFIPLNDITEKNAPVITKYFNEYPPFKKAMVAPDGKIYSISGFLTTVRELAARRWWINKAWADNVGLPLPKTTDELYTLLKAFKEKDANKNGDPNDEIPFGGMYFARTTVASTAPLGNYLSPDVPILTAFGYVDPRIDVINSKVVFVPTEPNYKEYLAYMNKLYSEGLIDREFFSQTDDQFMAKGGKGMYGALSYYSNWGIMPDESLWAQYVSIPPLTSGVNSTQRWPAWDLQKRGSFAITKNTKTPEALIRLLDWMFTFEGSEIVQMGVENGKWPEGEGGWELTKNAAGAEGYNLIYDKTKFNNFNEFRQQRITTMTLPYVSIPVVQPIVDRIATLDPRQVRLSGDINNNFSKYYSTNYPFVMMTKDENDEINMLQTDLYTYVEQMDARFITGEEPLSKFADFVKGCNERGAEKLIAIRQKVYDRWNSN
jgi:putative aldouronate transport system substrate-binding protein